MYKPNETYHAKRIGPLQIPVPDEINPALWPMMQEEERKRKEVDYRVPLFDYEMPYQQMPEKKKDNPRWLQ